jgi:hypothetical protein
MKKLIYSLILITYLNASTAHAEEAKVTAPKSNSKASTSTVKYKKNVSMEFEGRSVDGNVVSPDSADVEGDKNIKFDPLLEGRKDFKREFKRSSGVSR